MDPGPWNPEWIAGNGYSYAMALADGTTPVDTSGWDAKCALRAAFADDDPALLLTVGAGITVGGGTDHNIITITVTDTQTDALIVDLAYEESTPFRIDVTVLLDGASDWGAFLRGVATLSAAATRLGES